MLNRTLRLRNKASLSAKTRLMSTLASSGNVCWDRDISWDLSRKLAQLRIDYPKEYLEHTRELDEAKEHAKSKMKAEKAFKDIFLEDKIFKEGYPLANIYAERVVSMVEELERIGHQSTNKLTLLNAFWCSQSFIDLQELVRKGGDELKNGAADLDQTHYDFRMQFSRVERFYMKVAYVWQFFKCFEDIKMFREKANQIAPSEAKIQKFAKAEFRAKISDKINSLLNELSQASQDAESLLEKVKGGNFLDCSLETESMSHLKILAHRLFSKLRECIWEMNAKRGIFSQMEFTDLEGRLSRVCEARRIAVTKWNMRRKCIGEQKAKVYAQKESINLGNLNVELTFAVPETLIEGYLKETPQKAASATISQEEFLVPHNFRKDQKSTKFPLEKLALFELLMKLKNPSKQSAVSKTTQLFEISRLFEKEFAEEMRALVGSSKAAGVRVADVRLSGEEAKPPVQRAPHYRVFYPQRKAPAKHIPNQYTALNYDPAAAKTSKTAKIDKIVSVVFQLHLADQNLEEKLLRNLVQNWAFSSKFSSFPLLSHTRRIAFLDRHRPFELSDCRLHQICTEKAPDLTPWLNSQNKALLGMRAEDRFHDDPVEFVDDDTFGEYWRNVGLGMPEEKALRGEMHLLSSNDFALQKCHNTLLKLARSVFVFRRKLPHRKRRYTILKSTHVHGDAKDHLVELVYHHVYVFVVPESQRHLLDRAAQEVIALGCDARIDWEEALD